jgi:hypothetical protein
MVVVLREDANRTLVPIKVEGEIFEHAVGNVTGNATKA